MLEREILQNSTLDAMKTMVLLQNRIFPISVWRWISRQQQDVHHFAVCQKYRVYHRNVADICWTNPKLGDIESKLETLLVFPWMLISTTVNRQHVHYCVEWKSKVDQVACSNKLKGKCRQPMHLLCASGSTFTLSCTSHFRVIRDKTQMWASSVSHMWVVIFSSQVAFLVERAFISIRPVLTTALMVFLTISFDWDRTRLNFACQFWNFPLYFQIIHCFLVGVVMPTIFWTCCKFFLSVRGINRQKNKLKFKLLRTSTLRSYVKIHLTAGTAMAIPKCFWLYCTDPQTSDANYQIQHNNIHGEHIWWNRHNRGKTGLMNQQLIVVLAYSTTYWMKKSEKASCTGKHIFNSFQWRLKWPESPFIAMLSFVTRKTATTSDRLVGWRGYVIRRFLLCLLPLWVKHMRSDVNCVFANHVYCTVRPWKFMIGKM